MKNGRFIWEGAVIVVSILLAFAIDAWWDDRRDRVEEEEILAALTAEYQTNLNKVNYRIGQHLEMRGDVERLFGATDEEIHALPQDARSTMVVALCNPKTFDPVLGTTDALIGSGKLELIESQELRQALTTYLNLAQDASEDSGIIVRNAEQLWKQEIELGGPWTDPAIEVDRQGNPVSAPNYVRPPTVDDLLRLRGDEQLQGIVGRCHLNVGYYLIELYRLRTQAELVIKLIEGAQ